MRRRLAELDRLDRREGGGASLPSGRRRRRDRTLGPAAAAGLFAVVVAAGGLALGASGLVDRLAPGDRGSGDRALGAPAPDGAGGFVFTAHQPGRPDDPVGYSPCDEVRVVVNDAAAPPGTEGMVAAGLQEVSELTGLQLVLEGSTDELPGPEARRALDAPVLVAWTDPDQVPGLDGPVAGLAGSSGVTDRLRNRSWFRTGEVALDAPALATILQRPDGPAQVYAVVLHELGHLVGLGHVEDRRQLMHAENVGVTSFQAGDRRGLALLGGVRCR